jgi:hypothetical protein
LNEATARIMLEGRVVNGKPVGLNYSDYYPRMVSNRFQAAATVVYSVMNKCRSAPANKRKDAFTFVDRT